MSPSQRSHGGRRFGAVLATIAMATVFAGGSSVLLHNTTTGGSSSATPAEGWLLTTANVGLAPFGLSCASLPLYTGANPVPAGTHIFQKRIAIAGVLDLNNGGITIEQSCIRPTAASFLRIVESYTPPNPNSIIDSEIDGSLLTTQEAAFECATRGIFENLLRNYMHDVGSGICKVDYNSSITTSSLIENNLVLANKYYGDPATTGSHNEAATERSNRIDIDPNRTAIWRGNYFHTYGNSSAGFFTQTAPGYGDPIGNVYIQDNYFDGDGGLDLAGDGTEYSGHFELTNNRFVGLTDGDGWGTCAIVISFDVQSDNYIYDPSNTTTYAGAPVSC